MSFTMCFTEILVIAELSKYVVAINNFHSVSVTLCTVTCIHNIREKTRNSQKLGNNLEDDKIQNKDSRVKKEKKRIDKLISLRKKKRCSKKEIH